MDAKRRYRRRRRTQLALEGVLRATNEALSRPLVSDLYSIAQMEIGNYVRQNPGLKRLNLVPESFTCLRCSYARKCINAWDLYNIDGDCIVGK